MRIEIGSSNNHLLKDGAWLWLLRQFLGICLYACESIYSLNEKKNALISFSISSKFQIPLKWYVHFICWDHHYNEGWSIFGPGLFLQISKLKKIYLMKFDEVIVSAFFFPEKTLEWKMGSNA